MCIFKHTVWQTIFGGVNFREKSKVSVIVIDRTQVKFVNLLLKRHKCPVCLYAMRNPVQTECGHLFCQECLDPILKWNRPRCPMDKEEINPDSIFPDNACQREIQSLEVYCSFMTSGCEWIGALKNLEVIFCGVCIHYHYVISICVVMFKHA